MSSLALIHTHYDINVDLNQVVDILAKLHPIRLELWYVEIASLFFRVLILAFSKPMTMLSSTLASSDFRQFLGINVRI